MDVPSGSRLFLWRILDIRKSVATVKGIGLYANVTAEVHLKYIERLAGGRNCGKCKRDN